MCSGAGRIDPAAPHAHAQLTSPDPHPCTTTAPRHIRRRTQDAVATCRAGRTPALTPLQGGKIVAAVEGAEGAWGFGTSLARLWLFVLYTLMAPVTPLLRLLSSAPSETDEAGGSEAAPAARAAPPSRAAPPPAPETVSSVEDQV